MRIILIGQAAFGADSLKALIEQGENIVGVITVPDDPGQKRPNPLKEAAQQENIPLIQPQGLRGAEVYEWVKSLSPDLLVLAFVTDFVPKSVIDLATYGGINYHPSLLPKYRGGTAINWTVIYGEKETGVTIHYIDEGLDTGDIILQEKVDIGPDDTVASLYFNKLYPLGIRLIRETVKLIREGKAPRIPQDHRKASYQPLITEADVVIDWSKNTADIYNLIRGGNPTPGATTYLRREKLKIWEAKPVYEPPPPGSKTGEVIETKENKGFAIATGDGAILATRIQLPQTKKFPAAEAVAAGTVKKGDKLG